MNYWVLAVSAVITALLLVVYKLVINPQMLVTTTPALCPDRWNYSSSMCAPAYQTHCLPFNPQTVKTDSARCNIARTCGTNWGNC